MVRFCFVVPIAVSTELQGGLWNFTRDDFTVLSPKIVCVVADCVVGWFLDDDDRWLRMSRGTNEHDGGRKRTDWVRNLFALRVYVPYTCRETTSTQKTTLRDCDCDDQPLMWIWTVCELWVKIFSKPLRPRATYVVEWLQFHVCIRVWQLCCCTLWGCHKESMLAGGMEVLRIDGVQYTAWHFLQKLSLKLGDRYIRKKNKTENKN